MREDGGCSWMLNPGNKTGNGGEITEEESLRVDCFASSWAFHRMVRCCQRQRGKLTSFSPWNAFCRNALPASSHICEDPTALFFLHNRPPLRLHFCTKVHHHSIGSRTNKEAHFAMSQCVFWYSAAQDLAQTLSMRTLTFGQKAL